VSEFLAMLAALVLKVLLTFLVAKAQEGPRMDEGQRQPALRGRLGRRIRQTWGAVLIGALLVSSAGCASRTVYVPTGEPVRLRETVRSAKVWVMGPDGKAVAGVMDLPEGWYCLPDPGPAE